MRRVTALLILLIVTAWPGAGWCAQAEEVPTVSGSLPAEAPEATDDAAHLETPAEKTSSDEAAAEEVPAAPPANADRAPRRFVPMELSPHERLRVALFVGFGLVWFFWLGAAMGSYLNVVVLRMPKGLDSVAPDSRCPRCQTRIRWYDNIPIVSWLVLRGRCRACQQPISPRYLLVEIAVGLIFLGLLYVEVLSGGANLPGWPERVRTGLPVIEHFLEFDLIAVYFFHAALLWALFGIVLMRLDECRVPRPFIRWGLRLGILLPILWPGFRPDTQVGDEPAGRLLQLGLGLGGYLMGIVLSGIVSRSAALSLSRAALLPRLYLLHLDSTPAFVILGAALGWRGVLSVACWTLIVELSQRFWMAIGPRGLRWPLAVSIFVATVLHLTFWSTMTACPWWPGPETGGWKMLGTLVLLMLACRILGRLFPWEDDRWYSESWPAPQTPQAEPLIIEGTFEIPSSNHDP